MEIYSPSDDSYFFEEFLKKYLEKNKVNSYLDMGTGSGILSIAVSRYVKKENILTADINPDSVKFVKSRGIKSIKSDLFSKVNGEFDLITFNAPYLPFDSREPCDSALATTGGENGDEISLKFLEQSMSHLSKNGKIFLLISSLTPAKKIKKFKPKIVEKKKIFQETLLILEFSKV